MRIGRRLSTFRSGHYNSFISSQLRLTPTASSHLVDSSLSLPEMIKTSQTIKARLLHYFPPDPSDSLSKDDEPVDSWCGFHLDHSLFTGLCSVSLFTSVPAEG